MAAALAYAFPIAGAAAIACLWRDARRFPALFSAMRARVRANEKD